MPSLRASRSRNNQITGLAGAFYAAYLMSQRGWIVAPTVRNAPGVDLIATDPRSGRSRSFQCKSLWSVADVPFGESIRWKLIGDFTVFVLGLGRPEPQVFVVPSHTVKRLLGRPSVGKGGRKSYWLYHKDLDRFRDRWDTVFR